MCFGRSSLAGAQPARISASIPQQDEKTSKPPQADKMSTHSKESSKLPQADIMSTYSKESSQPLAPKKKAKEDWSNDEYGESVR